MMAILGTFRNDLSDFVNLSPQVRFLLVFQLVILFLLSVLVGIIFSPKFKSDVRMRAGVRLDTTPTQAPQAQNSLAFTTTSTIAKVGLKQRIDVVYSGDPAEVMDTVVSYNPQQIHVDNLKNGGIYDQVLQSKIEAKRVSFSAGFSLSKLAKVTPSTSGVIYSFTITPLQGADKIELSFVQPETFVWHQRSNIVSGFSNLTLAVSQK